MKIYTEYSGDCAPAASDAPSNHVQSHKWIVLLLADMVDYSETHNLHEVSASLIAAIEKISPELVGAGIAGAPVCSDGKAENKQDFGNVINFRN